MAGKLCWALGLVLLFAAAVLTQAPLAVGLLGFFLLLTLLLVLEVRYLRGKAEAELIVPDQPAVQGRPFVLTVRLTNHSPLPIPQLLTLVQATDEWGGNTITLRCSGMLGSKARAEQRLTLQANKSGVWQLRLQSVTLWDHLGLFKAQCGLPQTAQSLCVLPQSARLGSDTQPDPDADGMQESDRSVLGGNYDVREYREGDSLKQVHWKLSAKLNRLLIREPLAAGTMAGQGSGDGPGEGEGDMWGDFPAEAAQHRKAPPTKKKAVALSKRGGTDADSGLVFLDRVLISPAVPARDTLWLVVDLCLLLALAFGLVSAAVTAFAVHPPVWVWLALAAWCAGWCLFGRLPRRVQRLGLLAGSLVYLVGLFLCQRSFLAGARQFGAAVAASLNERFNANLAATAGGTPAQLGLFLALAALPLAGLLALAALLTTVRHNASAYLTGVWDTGSQTLVYGRIHQMEQGQYAPGGFLGVYTDDWSDDTNRALFRDDTPTDAAAFHPYTHQSGLQGWLFGRVNRLLRHRLPDGLTREAALYWLNSTLFYAAELLVALAVWEEFGPLAAAFGFVSVLLAPWLQRGMKDLYWCLWTWLLPLLAALWLCHCTRVRGKTPRGCWPLVAAACMVRCMCGFEFITTFLILCEIPLCYAAAKAYFVRRDPHGALVWLGRTVGAGVSALGGVTAALALWFAQEWLCFGSAADAWQNMTRAVTDRVSLTDGAVRDVNVPQVLAQYFRESTEPLLQLGPVSVTAWQLLLLALLVGAVCVVVCLRRGTAAQLVPPCIVWGLGLAAPASWMVLSKAHAAIHTHLVPMLWHFAFVPISCMLLPVLAKLMIPGRKKDLVASH